MKCRIFVVAIVVMLFGMEVCAQTLHVDSTSFIAGSSCCTYLNYATPTFDKGMLLVGYEYNSPGGIIPITAYAGINVLVVKIDSFQQISWIKIFGGNGDDGASSAVQTPDGGYAVLCGTASNDGDVTSFIGGTDIWLVRIDATGNLLWEKCYGSTSQDGPLSIANASDHGFILLGLTNGNDHDIPFHYGSNMLTDWGVIKIDSIGNVQWSRDVGGTADEGFGSVLAVDNGYYIACTSASIDHDCTDTAWHPAIPGTGTGNNFYLLRLDSAGNRLWDSSYGGSHSDAISYAMYDTRDSTILMVGTTTSNDYMVTGLHSCSDDASDIWMVKTAKNGKMLWEKSFGSRQEESGKSVCKRSEGGYLVLGTTQPGACTDPIGDIGNQDCWIFAIDSLGNIISDRVFGGTDADDPYSVIQYLNGYVVAGTSASSVFTEGTSNINNSGAFISYIDTPSLAVKNIALSKDKIKVYPNPTEGAVNIAVPDSEGTLEITNVLGQIVMYRNGSRQHIEPVDLSLWGSGVYVIRWQGADGSVQTAKLIKR